MRSNHYLYITLLAVLGWNAETPAQETTRQVPKLVVNITIDQLRSDYIETFATQYGENGFLRLLSDGLVYERASYPFSKPDRASAISSIITGTTPSYHSIIGAKWLNKETLQPMFCTDDTKRSGISSPSQLSVSTIGDELKVASRGNSKVFSIGPRSESAVLAAGHSADGVLWLTESTRRWGGSSYYATNIPYWVMTFNELKNAKRKKKRQILSTQQVNSDITKLAVLCVENLSMGNDSITDLLCLTYHASPWNRKAVTNWQSELRDIYVNLDTELDSLTQQLEKRIGKDNLLFVITSTGYSEEEEIDYSKYRIPTGTFYINRAANLLNMYLGALWGQGKYVEAFFDNQLFFNRKLLESKRISLTDVGERAQEFISEMAGVSNVYSSLQLLSGTSEQISRVRNGFHPERNGDILIEVAPGWHLQNEDTHEDFFSHSSFLPFPIILYGSGMKGERVKTPVTIDRIAPTVARIIRIRAPNACTSEPLF